MLECKHRSEKEMVPGWWGCASDRIFVKRNGLMHESTCLGECPHANQENINSGIQIALPPRSGPGTELSIIFAGLGIANCQACHDLAARMDLWGPQVCRDYMDKIVNEIFERAKAANWLSKIAVALAPGMIKQRIAGYVEQAIERAEKKG